MRDLSVARTHLPLDPVRPRNLCARSDLARRDRTLTAQASLIVRGSFGIVAL
jgi:hypothetical protein